MKLALLLSVLALAAWVGTACGEEDEENAPGGATVSENEESADGATVSLAADPDGLLIYDKKTVTAPAGTVTIEFYNPDSAWDDGHDVVVEDADGKEITRTDVIFEGETDTATGKFDAGKYVYYCSVYGHRRSGMEGKLTAE